ncbi:MAG: glycoside hydrolase family 38 C-terminal domain-containing protein [Candidatus Bathyarchaeia archaeon]
MNCPLKHVKEGSSLNNSKGTFEKIVDGLRRRYESLTGYRSQLSWKFYQGEALEAYDPNFDDSRWQQAKLPMVFDARKGEGWLRCKITVPEKIDGIEVPGSVVKLHSSAILGKSEVFVDGRRVLSADYWLELRPRVILDERTESGKTYVVAIHLFPKHEPIHVPQFYVTYSNIEKIAFEIESFIEEIRFARVLKKDFTDKILEKFDLSAIEGSFQHLLNEIDKVRREISPLSAEAKKFRVHLVAHAHIDMNWLWPWEDTLNTIKNTFSTMVNLMDKYGDFHFSQSQAVTYKTVEESFPDLFERIRQYVTRGNWDVTASMWVEADLNMAGTEALLRQFLYAKHYVYEKFNVKTEVCWEPDTFGHIWTLPQILRKFSIKYYYFMRCGKGHPIFWWEGPDGSRVLAFTSVYNNFVAPRNIIDLVLDLYERYGLKTSMFVYGAGDHGGGAMVEDIENTYEMRKKPTLPDLVFSSTHRFFNEVRKEIEDRGLLIPVINDELQFTFDGCYTTHGDVKKYNRLCESLLIDAEKICAITGSGDKSVLKVLWLKMLFNQFHDILDGSGSPEAYIYPINLYQETFEAAKNLIDLKVTNFSKKIKYSRAGIPIIVFNTLSWDRTDIVRVKVPKNLLPKNAVAISYDGKERRPIQIHEDELLFLASVPPLGYKVYYIVEEPSTEENSSSLLVQHNLLENDHFKIEINEGSGTIKTLYDKVNGRFVFKEERYPYTKPVFSNLMQILYETPHPMSAWIIGPISRVENLIRGAKTEVIEKGPVRATIKVSWKHSNSEITQYISLYNGLPRIDLRMLINWQELADDETDAPMLKVSYTPMLNMSKATFEIPFGYIERVPDGTEYPALRWVDLSDDEYGLSIISTCKHGFDVKGNTVRMTLVRTSYSPDPKPDQGIHEITYALYPHKNDWKRALTFRRGWELNHPLIAYAVPDRREHGSADEEMSFINVKPSNIVVSCFKEAEEGNSLVVRVYDASGEGGLMEIQFSFSVKEAYEADLMEEPIRPLETLDNKIRLQINPFEIKTLLIKPS